LKADTKLHSLLNAESPKMYSPSETKLSFHSIYALVFVVVVEGRKNVRRRRTPSTWEKTGLSVINNLPTEGHSCSKSAEEQTAEEEERFRRRRVKTIIDYP